MGLRTRGGVDTSAVEGTKDMWLQLEMLALHGGHLLQGTSPPQRAEWPD